MLLDTKVTLGTISSNQINTNTDEEGTCWESWCFGASSQSLGIVYNPLADMRILSALFDLLPWVEASSGNPFKLVESIWMGEPQRCHLNHQGCLSAHQGIRWPTLPSSWPRCGEKAWAKSGTSETGRSVTFTQTFNLGIRHLAGVGFAGRSVLRVQTQPVWKYVQKFPGMEKGTCWKCLFGGASPPLTAVFSEEVHLPSWDTCSRVPQGFLRLVTSCAVFKRHYSKESCIVFIMQLIHWRHQYTLHIYAEKSKKVYSQTALNAQ